jgi:hypothetical protein
MAEPFDAQAFTSQLRAALAEAMPTAEFSEELDDDMAALTFVHPVHEATVLLVIEPAMDPVPATLMAAIVIGDWVEAQQTAGGAALLALNPRLMTCSVGLLPINNDELAVVLCRRVPASSVLPGDVVGLVDDMIWEYAQVAGWVEQDGTDAAPPVRQSRLIGSLDEL